MKILAVDYGERRTGLAISDELGIAAHGLDTIEIDDESELPARIARIAQEKGVEKIVIGLPLNMDGTESEKSRKVRSFGTLLAEEFHLPVVYWDERMTSVQAHRIMKEVGKKTYRNKREIDRISAILLLQEYLKIIS